MSSANMGRSDVKGWAQAVEIMTAKTGIYSYWLSSIEEAPVAIGPMEVEHHCSKRARRRKLLITLYYELEDGVTDEIANRK